MNLQKEMPSLQLGKKGYNAAFLEEILKYMKKNTSIKVKFLKNALGNTERETLADLIIGDISKKFPVSHKVVGNVLFIEKIKK